MDGKIKHLEFIQSNIARMNQASFQMKGWMITVVTAIMALYATTYNTTTDSGIDMLFYIAVVPVILFWFLDSYYLKQERRFRGLYNDIISEEGSSIIKEFDMPLERYTGCKYCMLHIMFSVTEWPLYVTVAAGLILAERIF